MNAETAKFEDNSEPLSSSIKAEFYPDKLLPSLTAGMVTGVIGIIRGISYAALIFSGTLASYLNVGVGIAVFSTAAISIVVALTSGLPGMIATPLAAPSAILAILAAAIAKNMADAPAEEMLLTVVGAIAISSIITGLFLLVMGRLKLGNAVQFVPYPVIGGFMAGTGCLLIKGAVEVTTDIHLTFAQLPHLLEADVLSHWLSGLAIAVVLLLVLKRNSHFTVVPGVMLGAGIIFYLILWFTHTPIEAARTAGWLLGPFPETAGLWQPLHLADLNLIHWSEILSQAWTIAAVTFVSLVSLVLTNNGIELAVGREIELNKELESIGLANFFAGLGTGMAGNQALPSTLLVHKMKANNRLAGVFKTIPCSLVLLLGASFLSFFPKPILGGLLFYLGIDLLIKWIYQSWFKLPLIDWLVIITIMAAINYVGFLEGILVGLGMEIVLFAIKYSRINVTRNQLSGTSYQTGGAEKELLLPNCKKDIYIFQLHNFIFFGTANNLLNQVREKVRDAKKQGLRFIILDFNLVSGIDSTAAISFAKMAKLAEKQELTLAFTSLSADIEKLLVQGEVLGVNNSQVQVFAQLQEGINWWENNNQANEKVESNLSEKAKTIAIPLPQNPSRQLTTCA